VPSSVEWGKRPSKKAAASSPNDLDRFVNPAKAKAVRRLNLNIPVSLHARIKAQCAFEGCDMTQALIEMLEARFPADRRK
jgi:hypothetical protein